MMKKVIYGFNHAPIGTDTILLKCPSCEKNSWADVMIVSKYAHIYWIPFYPAYKEVNAICQSCGIKRYGIPLDVDLINNYDVLRKKYRHPWYTYLGIALIVLIIICTIISLNTFPN